MYSGTMPMERFFVILTRPESARRGGSWNVACTDVANLYRLGYVEGADGALTLTKYGTVSTVCFECANLAEADAFIKGANYAGR
jgi:hypothetical protein